MAGASDVEAGRAFVTLYLRRTNYDRQVDDLKRSEGSDRPSQAIASTSEAGVAIPSELADAAVKGAGMRAGAVMAAKLVPALREVTTVAVVAAPAVASVGVAATATAPAVAATGVAATGAATGFAAMWAAAAPILVPLAAVAAAAGLIYVAFAKWDELPFLVKGLLLALFPLVAVVRAAVLAFKALKLAVAVVTAPIWLTTAAVRGLFTALRAIPRAITATIGLMGRLSAAATKMAAKVASAAVSIPGRLARSVSAGLRNVGVSIAKLGAMAAGITALIVGPATLAARSWAAYGETIRGVQNDLLKFQLTAEEASIIARVSEQTGESAERLAKQMRDGTRDFSRWRNELQQSGTLMSGPQLAAALALSRAYFSLKSSVIGLKNSIAEALGPTLTASAELFTGMVRGVTRWVSENKPLIIQTFKIASAVGIAAGVITTLGGAIAGVGALVSPFAAWMGLLAGVMAGVEVKTKAGQSLWTAYGDSVRRVYGTVVQYLGQMVEFVDEVIGGVVDALMAGDLAGAVDVMWSAAKVAWITALLEIDELTSGTFGGILQSLAAGKWAAAGESLVGVLTEVWIRIVDAADTAWVGLLSGFDLMVGGMKSGLHGFLDWAIVNVFTPMAHAIGKIPGFDVGAEKAAFTALGQMLDARGGMERSMAAGGEDREGPLADRRAAREREITALRRRQTELANQSGEQAEQERTANQTALDAALAAAAAARAAAEEGKLQEEDFAVSQDVQSIARFSGEALGLSIGRGNDPAQRQARLTEDQLRELQGLREDLAETQQEILRLAAMGGFA